MMTFAEVIRTFRRISGEHPDASVSDIMTAVAVSLGLSVEVAYGSLDPLWWKHLHHEHEHSKRRRQP